MEAASRAGGSAVTSKNGGGARSIDDGGACRADRRGGGEGDKQQQQQQQQQQQPHGSLQNVGNGGLGGTRKADDGAEEEQHNAQRAVELSLLTLRLSPPEAEARFWREAGTPAFVVTDSWALTFTLANL